MHSSNKVVGQQNKIEKPELIHSTHHARVCTTTIADQHCANMNSTSQYNVLIWQCTTSTKTGKVESEHQERVQCATHCNNMSTTCLTTDISSVRTSWQHVAKQLPTTTNHKIQLTSVATQCRKQIVDEHLIKCCNEIVDNVTLKYCCSIVATCCHGIVDQKAKARTNFNI